MKTLRPLLALAVVALALSACSADSPTAPEPETNPNASQTVNSDPVEGGTAPAPGSGGLGVMGSGY